MDVSRYGALEREGVPLQIARRVLRDIAEQQLRPGERLPPERDLANRYGVSRPSLREAVRALSLLGVVESRHGSGTFVTSLDPQVLLEPLAFVLSLSDPLLEQLFEARRTVEVAIARLAAERITDAQVAELQRLVDHGAEVVDDAAAWLESDVALHAIISDACGNPLLSRFMESIHELGRASRARTGQVPVVRQQALDDHTAIVAALRERDPDAAGEAMLAHLEHVRRTFLDAISSENEESPTA